MQSAARIWPQRAAHRLRAPAAGRGTEPARRRGLPRAGSIALRFGELGRADREFADALARVPDDAYATLERGAIASTEGRRAAALVLLERAAQLNPRDPLTAQALQIARHGGRVSVEELNRAILQRAREYA